MEKLEASSAERKKAILIRVLQILEKYTDEKHPLKQSEIIDIMERDYGLTCERKAITRNVALLKSMGYEIVGSRKGSFLVTRRFEISELRLLIDSVLGSRYITSGHLEDLINKIAEFGGKNFRTNAKHIFAQRSMTTAAENKDLFFNVEILDEAIDKHVKVKFFFNRYDENKHLAHTTKEKQLVNPYQLIVHNQRYYLAGNADNYNDLIFYRVDRITDIEITDEIYKPIIALNNCQEGVKWGEMITKLPYLYVDKPENITLLCEPRVIDELVGWFGFDFTATKTDSGRIKVELSASPKAMQYWLIQYGTDVEVVAPAMLRTNVIERIKLINKRYGLMPIEGENK